MSRRFSMRLQVVGLVVFAGLIGLALALLAGEYYRHLMRDSLAHIATLKAEELLGDEQARARDLALELQHGEAFRRAFRNRNQRALEALLEPPFRRTYVTADAMKVIGMHVLDLKLHPVARVDRDPGGDALCPELLARVRARPAAERIKPIAALCAAPTHVHHVTLVAVGGLHPAGYLAVVTDPTPALQRVERSIGMPLRVMVGLNLLYSSPAWPDLDREPPLVASAALEAYGPYQPTLELAGGTGEFGSRIRNARMMVLLADLAATVGVVWLALWMFNRCTLRPLARLTERMRLVRTDRTQLGSQIVPSGNAEMRELAEDFNEFSAELKELHATMESLAYKDTLTGLPNRLVFRDRLEQQIRLFERDGERFAVCLVDLDRFKEINDTHGHHVGDLLLQQVAKRMRRALRKSDTVALAGSTVARLGGDEFCVLLPSVRNGADAAAVAAKLLAAMNEPFEIEERRLKAGMSIGFALFPDHAEAPDPLCRCADAAMYQAKRNGTGFAVFDAQSVVSAVAS